MTPRATMRLQFHRGFTFADAEGLLPYLSQLGVSHIYASPITTARKGSRHGYDVVDPTRVNPELGGEEGLRRLAAKLGELGMGLIADIVPNHMAASLENPWWVDVLRHGETSRYARFFDIDWQPEDRSLHGKLFLPVLDRPLSEVVASGELVRVSGDDGDYLRYRDLLLPLNGDSDRGIDLERQAYRLGWWRTSGDRINWRRFFDINDLVCLRMEDDAFASVHALVSRLYREGVIAGVRVDHIDGIADPADYCRRLRRTLDPVHPERPYLVVEKILLHGETLPADWQCQGTTGYDFMDEVNALQHDPHGGELLAECWSLWSGRAAEFAQEAIAARREIIERSFAAPLDSCARAFAQLAGTDREAGELSRPALRRALKELLAHFPIYRTYATRSERPQRDQPYLQAAVTGARATALAQDRWVLDLLHRWMGEPHASGDAIRRFQQLSAPVAAKAIEDTAFYRYGRLLSRNDVGFDPGHFSLLPSEFHDAMRRRLASFPHALLATATHDHKRGEDVRARLAVLSERPQDWARHVERWLELSLPLWTDNAPAAGDVVMLLQMLVGAWPLDLELEDRPGRSAFAQRLAQWQEKAVREAKLRSDWSEPNQAYESAARRFVVRLVAENALPDLLADIVGFVQGIAAAGAINSLAQTLLKLTVPGVPDLYQGTDYWDFSLVDPDNRRPVAFDARARSLGATGFSEALAHWRDGRLKQLIVARALALRGQRPALFAEGSYEPLEVRGPWAEHVLAFARRLATDVVIVAVTRLPDRLIAHRERLTPDRDAWHDTSLSLPNIPLRDVLMGEVAPKASRKVATRDLFASLPVALLST